MLYTDMLTDRGYPGQPNPIGKWALYRYLHVRTPTWPAIQGNWSVVSALPYLSYFNNVAMITTITAIEALDLAACNNAGTSRCLSRADSLSLTLPRPSSMPNYIRSVATVTVRSTTFIAIAVTSIFTYRNVCLTCQRWGQNVGPEIYIFATKSPQPIVARHVMP